ncbi:hypothetical protein H0I23_07120 [Cellulophaga sp. HaHaR_3_176]|uniref:hypothetical protein n=1 Tax=Cellulophaga sp. HaHaR_3_176 TaxID=1942464 RepID=UPI001C1FD9C7|nr:hypothetical protein [Cellulophaga sp. HaHaR_3_176]QWX85405.1 hypothetical protein H0I23_07120 [Cellulophaga sp. HaHaR_3_176]
MGFFSKKKYYIKLYVNRIEIIDLIHKKSISETSEIKYNNQRLLIADFNTAEKFISNVFKKNGLSLKNSVGIIQQMELSEGGLSSIEKRILFELFSGVGVKETFIDESLVDLTEQQLVEYGK